MIKKYMIIYFEPTQGWLQDDQDGIRPLSIGLEGVVSRGKIIARMAYLNWVFDHENYKGDLWFRMS